MTVTVFFDDSLGKFAEIVAEELGDEGLAKGRALRDVMGRLAFVSSLPLADAEAERLAARLREELGPYARTDRTIVGPGDYGGRELLEEPFLSVTAGSRGLQLVDRRLVGADWLTRPSDVANGVPRFVFASLKGGVGRSTALAVAAAHRASKGDRVLAIDMDLEAPGLGSMLLDEETLPEFGVLDALVEGHMAPLTASFLADLVGPSPIAGEVGAIDVAPAFGRRSRKNAPEILAKLARAYMEQVREEGPPASVLDQVRWLVDSLAAHGGYDAIFVDMRAGLHETAASGILGLGAEVFLFGQDERQTFDGYAALLGHLARFVKPGAPAPEWFLRLTMVQAKAPLDPTERAAFAERCRTLFCDAGFGASLPPVLEDVLAAPASVDVPWDEDAPDDDVLPDEEWTPRAPVAVAFDDRFHRFDPFGRRDLLTDRVYGATYAELLGRIDEPFQAREPLA